MIKLKQILEIKMVPNKTFYLSDKAIFYLNRDYNYTSIYNEQGEDYADAIDEIRIIFEEIKNNYDYSKGITYNELLKYVEYAKNEGIVDDNYSIEKAFKFLKDETKVIE